MFSWFAARPLAQAKAAVICSLLPWPDGDEKEQSRLRDLVRRAMAGRDAAHAEVTAELAKHYPDGASMLDPFSGRAMVPLEAARLGVKAWGIDYSHVATLAGSVLADFPLRDWASEPPLPFEGCDAESSEMWGTNRLVIDVEAIFRVIDSRHKAAMADWYPKVDGKQPWGYLWTVTLPCQNCSRRFPLVGSLVLRYPNPKRNDPGESFLIRPSKSDPDAFEVEVHDGDPVMQPTRTLPPGQSRHSSKGKVGICIFCDQPHQKSVLERLADEQHGEDALLLVGDLDDTFSKTFRVPTDAEFKAVAAASKQLRVEPNFAPGLPAVPDEKIPPGNTWTIQPSLFGARTYGDLCNDRQTLSFVTLARIIDDLAGEMRAAEISSDYTNALCAYSAAVMVRKLRRSTRGATLQTYWDGRPTGVHDVFGSSESSIAFNYDYFEVGLSDAAGGWSSIAGRTMSTLRDQLGRSPGRPANIQQGSATMLPLRQDSLDAVVTDPPYDDMIDYSDASDLFFVWLKRALITSQPAMASTAHPLGVQEKDLEIIVKKGGAGASDHRTKDFYNSMLSDAFREGQRVVRPDGVVTIVFGHGDHEVWHRLLTAISGAGLVLTGSWPARTEKGGRVGSANIQTTLTLACRAAPPGRTAGRVSEVDAEVREEILQRLPLWDAAGLALTDQLMASAGPAMEVVGRYSEVLDKTGSLVSLDRYLPLARQMVQEAANIQIDHLPLETFDERTRFAIFWARVYRRNVAPGSEARWQRLAADMDEDATTGILRKTTKGGVQLESSKHAIAPEDIDPTTPVFDVALSMAAEGKSLARAADVALRADKVEDPYLWATLRALSDYFPEADPDGEAWTFLVRNKGAVKSATRNVAAIRQREADALAKATVQGKLDFGWNGTEF